MLLAGAIAAGSLGLAAPAIAGTTVIGPNGGTGTASGASINAIVDRCHVGWTYTAPNG
jgi:hypothetical protein